MKMDKSGVLRIGVFANRMYKSDRDRVSGIMRYFRDHPDPKAIIIDLVPSGKRTQNGKSGECGNLDGVLIMDPDISPASMEEIPYVAEEMNRGLHLDDEGIGATAARLFMRRGYCNFAYIGNNANLESVHSEKRRDAFSKTVAEGGFSCAVHSCNGKYSGRELASFSKFLLEQPKPCAVMAYSDHVAKLVYDACSLANLSIPDQIGVIGVDNEISICETMRPPLTSILPDFESCGYIAAEMLMQKILRKRDHPENRSYGIRAVFERESSMDIDGSARLVTQARAYIATHYPEPLRVSAIAKHLGTCRRRLELKFRKVIGRTVHDEIKHVRLGNAKKLLANTNLPVGEISSASGYGCEAAFRNAFLKSEHMSPRAYRKNMSAQLSFLRQR